MTPERVAAACSTWNWYPDDAETHETDDVLVVRWPAYFEVPPSVIRLDPEAPVAETLDVVEGQARGWGAAEYLVWVKLDAPDGLEPALQERGGALEETVDVFALDLTGGAPDLAVPDDVEVGWQVDEASTRAALQVGIAAFEEGSVPDDATVRRLASDARRDHEAGEASCAVAHLDGEPAGTGGLTMDGDVARVWGGGVTPVARGRGVYRAVLDARLRRAVDLGATMALVKGRVETSGPILRRAGFEVFGQERSYVVRLRPGT